MGNFQTNTTMPCSLELGRLSCAVYEEQDYWVPGLGLQRLPKKLQTTEASASLGSLSQTD